MMVTLKSLLGLWLLFHTWGSCDSDVPSQRGSTSTDYRPVIRMQNLTTTSKSVRDLYFNNKAFIRSPDLKMYGNQQSNQQLEIGEDLAL